MKNLLIRLGQSLFGGIGFWWLFLEAFYGLDSTNSPRMTFLVFLLIGLSVGGIWFFIDGVYVTGFLKRSVDITSNAIDTIITIKFGDLFDQDGYKAISVNEFFDSAVDERHVALNSLHGLMLARYWSGNTLDWDTKIQQSLAKTPPIDVVGTRPSPGKQNRYSLGTTAAVSTKGQEFLCFVLTRTDLESLEASATSDDLRYALRELLAKARTICSGRPLNIPLVGSGLSRTGIKSNIIIDLIMLAIFEESKKRKITNQIRIVLPKNMKNRINLETIKEDWR